ncbi:exported hypothetical protein [Verrucomicrobia bacterium]|nr:exported hypothetical protein [Verrucomicrobiota bacterium]
MIDKSQRKEVRPAFLASLVVLAGVAVAGILFLGLRHSQPPAPAVTDDQTAATTSAPSPEPTQPVSSEPASAPTAKPAPAQTQIPNAAAVESPTSVPKLAKTLNDETQPLKARAAAAKALAAEGSYEAITALAGALPNSPDALRAAIAQALGTSPSAQSVPMLAGMLSDASEAVALAAVRALADQGTPQAIASLSQSLFDLSTALNVRCETALALGSIDQPGIVDVLARATTGITDEDVVTQVLNALGSRDISETKGAFQNYLSSATVSPEMKVTAVEAIGQTQGDASAFLASIAQDQTQPADVRAAAAWAMSTTQTEGTQGPQLTTMLQTETDPDVRRRIYQALANQEDFDVSTIQAMVQKETDKTVQVAGLDLLAGQLRQNPSSSLQSFFDQTAAPELKNLALNDTTASDRMAAVVALVRAGTPDAMAALQQLIQQSTDPRVIQSARSGLTKPGH